VHDQITQPLVVGPRAALDTAAAAVYTYIDIHEDSGLRDMTLSVGVQFPMFLEIAAPSHRRYLYTNLDSFTSAKTGIFTNIPLWQSDISYAENTQAPTYIHKLPRMCSLYDTSASTRCAYCHKTCALSYMKGVRNNLSIVLHVPVTLGSCSLQFPHFNALRDHQKKLEYHRKIISMNSR
jgi:hypothetical protein